MRRNITPFWDGQTFLALVVLFFCLISFFVVHEEVYKRTPDYSVHCLMQALQNGDSQTVNEYVDEAALSNQFFDALVSHNSDSTDQAFLLNLVRSPLRANFTNNATTLMTWTLAKNTDSEAYRNLEMSLGATLKSAGLPLPASGWHLDAADWSNENTITLHLYNDRLNLSVPCTVTLEKMSSKTWRITGLAHPDSFVHDLRQALENKLAAYNEPIQSKIDATLEVSDISSQLLASNKHTYFLRLSYTPEIKSKAGEITSVKALYTLHRKRDDAVLYTAPIRLSLDKESSTHQYLFRLNPLIPSQAAIINQGNLDGLTSNLHITDISFSDGSTLSLADHLPENNG